jgi:hypothetical protein
MRTKTTPGLFATASGGAKLARDDNLGDAIASKLCSYKSHKKKRATHGVARLLCNGLG